MISQQLRMLRTQRGMSLRSLAAETGVSATLLSQIERDVTEPSLATLRRLAEFFGEPVSSLFDDQHSPPVWVSRPGARSTITGPRGKLRYERLTPSNGQMEVLRGILGPGETTADELWAHSSLECAVVVKGTLTVDLGTDSHLVGAGEAITFDARQAHRYRNDSDSPVEFLVSVTPPNP
ncbi:helix-turn-helix domain-containing protein [Streptomyces sp. NPDC091040]|uniref:helix-turn-helix domain-containing protein n=1 Tax=Streptomyces sp. NPDC091040 TaxID=3365972 RepID=UPI003826A392